MRCKLSPPPTPLIFTRNKNIQYNTSDAHRHASVCCFVRLYLLWLFSAAPSVGKENGLREVYLFYCCIFWTILALHQLNVLHNSAWTHWNRIYAYGRNPVRYKLHYGHQACWMNLTKAFPRLLIEIPFSMAKISFDNNCRAGRAQRA